MKNLFNILQKWRQFTALILLLNFVIVPMATAFPTEECNEACEVVMPLHECNSEQLEDDCCDVIVVSNSNIKSTPSTECGMVISDINCSIVINDQVKITYIIPKTVDNKVDFIQITTIDFKEDNSIVELLGLTDEFSFSIKPHIYLTNLAFLI